MICTAIFFKIVTKKRLKKFLKVQILTFIADQKNSFDMHIDPCIVCVICPRLRMGKKGYTNKEMLPTAKR